jgi:hypothetical protein
VFVVRHGGRPVAASLVHWHRDTIEVPWASALREFNPLCANVLLYWQMLRFAIERGARTFDFGRSTPGEGTFHFKRQWGAEPRELVWEYWTAGAPLPDLSPANPKFALAIAPGSGCRCGGHGCSAPDRAQHSVPTMPGCVFSLSRSRVLCSTSTPATRCSCGSSCGCAGRGACAARTSRRR